MEVENVEIRYPYGFIYITTNLINGKRYLGLKRFNVKYSWLDYLGSGVFLKEDIETLGKENFSRNIILICYSEEELNRAEYDLSVFFNVVESSDWYNVVYGGGSTSGYHHTEQTKEKISETKQGMHNGSKNPMYGRPWWNENTPQEKIYEWLKRKSEASTGKNNPNYGVACTEEKRNKLMQSNPNKKELIHFDADGSTVLETYCSIRDASRKTGIDRRTLKRYCDGLKVSSDNTLWKFNDKKEI